MVARRSGLLVRRLVRRLLGLVRARLRLMRGRLGLRRVGLPLVGRLSLWSRLARLLPG